MREDTDDGPGDGARARHALARDAGAVDLAAVFAAMPGIDLVLAPDAPRYTMLAATDGRLAATMTTREGTLGRPLFDVFPDANPANAAASGVGNLRSSLDTVLRTRAPHRMAVQRYDLQCPDGTWEERYWAPLNVPVLGPDGSVRYVIHRVEDVSAAVRLAAEGDRLRGAAAGSERARASAEAARDEVAAAHAQLAAAHAQLQDQALELELANQQLQDQAAELELQAEELQATAAHLEEKTEDAERTRQVAEAERARAMGILEAMADAYFALDRDFRVVAVNAAMERSTGLARDALLGRVFWEVFPGTVGTAYERHYRAAATEGVEAHFTDSYDDGRLTLASEADVYPVAGGGVAVFWRDVTARVQAEAALRESEARYRGLFERIDEGFCVFELIFDDRGAPVDYRFVEANPAFVQQTGLSDPVGHTIRELVPGIEAHWIETYGRVARTGESTRFQQGSDVMGRWFDVFAFRAGRPEECRVALLFTDVSAARAAERERERLLAESEQARAEAEAARAEADRANRAKAEFLATMSHELRTPLNAIGGYAELLEMGLRGPVTDQQRTDLGRIQQSQRHLLGLVNEVLDLARVDSGELRVERAAVRAGDTVDAALALVRPQAAAKGLGLSEACGGAADRPYLGDEPRVRQVLVNLLANAVKFTSAGGRVAVTCALSDSAPPGAALAPDTPYVALRVYDTGVGIAPDQQTRIFEPFTQTEGGLTRQRGGTGLGLAISRRLARLMGGDVTVESRPGAGSAFTLWLPTPERRARARPRPAGAAAGPAAARERPTPPATPAVEVPGLARVGEALVADVAPVVRAWVARLRADPGIPDATARTDAELEDHAATLVTDVALAVRTMGQPGGEPAALLRDGTAIMALIAERHGAQRARLGWPEAALAREFALLGEMLDAAVRRLAASEGGAEARAAERAAAVAAQLVSQAARLSLGGYRLTTGGAGV